MDLTGCAFIPLALSLHFGNAGDSDSNWFHPSAGVQCEEWAGGVFLNSKGRVSATLAKRWEWGMGWMEVGAATGYNDSVMPTLRIGYEIDERVDLFFVPTGKGGVVGIQFKF